LEGDRAKITQSDYPKSVYYKVPFEIDSNEYLTEDRWYYNYNNGNYTKINKMISYLDSSLSVGDKALTYEDRGKTIGEYTIYKPDTFYYIPEKY